MAYAAVTSLMETLSLHFLQSQPPFPLEDLAAQMRDDANEHLGFLQQILEPKIREMELDEAASSKGWIKLHGIFNNGTVKQSDYTKKKKLIKSEKQQQQQLLAECSSQNERITNWLRKVGEVKQKIVSLHQNLGLLQQSLDKSEIPFDDAVIKDLEAQIRDASFKAEQRIEMELTAIYLAKESLLHVTACLLRFHQILNRRHSPLSRIREEGEVKQKMVSLQENLGLLKDILQKSDVAGAMKDLEAEIRDVWLKEERIEIDLTTISLAKQSLLHLTACLLSRLHQIFIEAKKQTDYHRNELIRIQTHEYQLSLLARIRRRGLQLVKGSSQHHLVHKKIIVNNFSKKASKFDGGMVGCEKLFEKVMDQLLTQQTTKGRQVVSVVGMGGIGKTTLARKVYEQPSITSYFDMRAWVTVSQEFNNEQMLRCLIGCVTAASRDELHKQSTNQDQLAERLRKHLKGQRYLIVMDDIWNTTAWDSVQRCFPDDNNGSRILLTSRLREVAEYASSGNSPLNMPFLDAYESWNLYCKVFGKTEFHLVFEKIGRDIVKKCEGLPLAITVVASLLSKTEEDEEKWKNVVATSAIDDSNDDACSRILYLSYNQLPHHLKACFLYFGVFQEDYEIHVKKLVRLWAAEGFLRAMKHVNMEEVAIECLQDLVDRSLVIVSKHSYNGKMKRIKIHDMLRDLCLREARHENLLSNAIIGDQEFPFNTSISPHQFSKPCRWVSTRPVFLRNQVKFKWFEKSHSLHLGSCYSGAEFGLFSHMKLLRVVDIEGDDFDGRMALNVLANLVHLRYLALSTCRTFEVKLFENWNMQSFVVRGDGATLYSSESFRIWKMPRLKNFCIGRILSLKTSSVVHRNLENISWLDHKLCKNDLFTMIPSLKKLGIDFGLNVINPYSFYNFENLKQLEKLSIRRCQRLIEGNIPWATNLLPNIKRLNLLGSIMWWSSLSLISMFPNLEVLKVINSCLGKKWELSDEVFPRLKRLVIKNANLEYWNAVGDHFPVLECLELSNCHWLEEIPRGFADIATLALIQLSKCKDSVVASAKWIQEEQNNNYGNDVLVRSEDIMRI